MKKQVYMHSEGMKQCKRKKSRLMSDMEVYKICLEKKR